MSTFADDGASTNRGIPVEAPPPGIVIYRFEESFLYPNASFINDRLVSHVKETTRRGRDMSGVSKGDRPWNDPGPRPGQEHVLAELDASKPLLKAVILDFQAVANLDTTGVQNLVDARKEVEKWADRAVEFHFSGILSPWIRRALIAAGFGQGQARHGTALEIAPVVAQDDALAPADKARFEAEKARDAGVGEGSGSNSEDDASFEDKHRNYSTDLENGGWQKPSNDVTSVRSLPLLDKATPFVSTRVTNLGL
jgi:sodium-independent sulfate anion transporter 11